jgi:hypothetical protein
MVDLQENLSLAVNKIFAENRAVHPTKYLQSKTGI